MKLISSASDLQWSVNACLRNYSQIRFAVAWASQQFDLGRELSRYSRNVKQAVVGTHFFQTDPEFMKSWNDHPNVRFNLITKGVFHPKVYLFENGPTDWAAIVGSSNFTRGGFCLNQEASVYVTSETPGAERFYQQLRNLINGYYNPLEKLTDKELDRYIAMRKSRRAALADLEAGDDVERPAERIDFKLSEVLHMDWEKFSKAIRSRNSDQYNERIFILNTFRHYFGSKIHFAKFSDWEQKRVAGLAKGEGSVDWQYFGANNVALIHIKSLEAIADGVSRALDAIPITGEVSRENVLDFIHEMRATKDKGIGPGIMTRFLAMKRPDQFVCINSKSREHLAVMLGRSVGEIFDVDNYWDEVVLPIRESPWWKSPNPGGGPTVDAWHGRVALLDCICYDPNAE